MLLPDISVGSHEDRETATLSSDIKEKAKELCEEENRILIMARVLKLLVCETSQGKGINCRVPPLANQDARSPNTGDSALQSLICY